MMVLKWLKRNLFPLLSSKNWNINLYSIGGFQVVEVTDPPFLIANTAQLYEALLDFLLKDCECIVLCQFIDESQGMLEHKEQVLPELTQIYDLNYVITESYTSKNQPNSDVREYILNVIGRPKIEWLKKVLAYGGTSLSNIIYGYRTVDDNWLETMVKSNNIFTKWYWLETDNIDIVQMRGKLATLCWTSDSHLNVLLDESKISEILQMIKEIANKNSLIVNVNKKEASNQEIKNKL